MLAWFRLLEKYSLVDTVLCKTTTLNTPAQSYFEKNRVNWWRTPPESPDANPIENLWHELKEFLRREVKPKTKQELINGILRFWDTVSVEKCRKYISHLRKVIPRIIELKGDATGYWTDFCFNIKWNNLK